METSIREMTTRATSQLSAWQARALAVGAAIVVNVIILFATRLIAGDFPAATVGDDVQEIGPGAVIVVTAVAGLLAWGLLAAFERLTARATAIWTAVALAAFLVSLLGPLGAGETTSSKVALVCLHAGAAATLIPLLRASRAGR